MKQKDFNSYDYTYKVLILLLNTKIMKKSSRVSFLSKGLLFAFLLVFYQSKAQSVVNKALQSITSAQIKEYIDYLASDEMKGRATPSVELDKAAQYIADKFAAFGIQKINNTYFQEVPFCAPDLVKEKCSFTITRNGQTKEFTLKNQYNPLFNTASGSLNAAVVFVGYGITAPEYNYDDYKNIDVKGKIVLVMKHEPGENDKNSIFDGVRNTKYASIETKIENAVAHGAAGLLLVTDPLNHYSLHPQGYNWKSLSSFVYEGLNYELCDGERKIPAVQVGENVIEMLLGNVDELKKIQQNIDKLMQPNSFEIKGAKVELATEINLNSMNSKNVVGYIEGSDATLKKEYIVIGAHYDHIGYKKKHKQGEDYIFNGADDNASGTAGVIAIANALSRMKEKPKRSVIFILFTAEEVGLIGSEYYVNHPLFPLENTRAMLNLDMISRNHIDSLEFEGAEINPDLGKIVEQENQHEGFVLYKPTRDLYGFSDHYNFFKKNITAMSFFTGLHEDYHKVGDNPDKINAEMAARVYKLAFRVLWNVANDNKHYQTKEYKARFF